MRIIWLLAATLVFMASGRLVLADNAVDPKAVKSEDGKYLDKEGSPTFNVGADGTVEP